MGTEIYLKLNENMVTRENEFCFKAVTTLPPIPLEALTASELSSFFFYYQQTQGMYCKSLLDKEEYKEKVEETDQMAKRTAII